VHDVGDGHLELAGGRKDSSFSEEKEAKRLLSICAALDGSGAAQRRGSFLVLFFKKERAFFP
jgi:hypothetical protein